VDVKGVALSLLKFYEARSLALFPEHNAVERKRLLRTIQCMRRSKRGSNRGPTCAQKFHQPARSGPSKKSGPCSAWAALLSARYTPINRGPCYFGFVLDGLPGELGVLEGEPVEGEPVEGEPVEGLPDVPEESPFIVGLELVVPVLVDPLVPCPVVLPLVPYAPVAFGSVLLPMLPGWVCVPCVVCEPCVLWAPVVSVCPDCVLEPTPVLPAAPVPAPLPAVWARAKVPSDSVTIKRSFRIVSDLSLVQVCVVAAPCDRFLKTHGVFM
jgi:hypothetical protein